MGAAAADAHSVADRPHQRVPSIICLSCPSLVELETISLPSRGGVHISLGCACRMVVVRLCSTLSRERAFGVVDRIVWCVDRCVCDGEKIVVPIDSRAGGVACRSLWTMRGHCAHALCGAWI